MRFFWRGHLFLCRSFEYHIYPLDCYNCFLHRPDRGDKSCSKKRIAQRNLRKVCRFCMLHPCDTHLRYSLMQSLSAAENHPSLPRDEHDASSVLVNPSLDTSKIGYTGHVHIAQNTITSFKKSNVTPDGRTFSSACKHVPQNDISSQHTVLPVPTKPAQTTLPENPATQSPGHRLSLSQPRISGYPS